MRGLIGPLPQDVANYTTNTTLHGRSKYRPDDVPGHNVVEGYNHPGIGDAVDLFCEAGTLVCAMHAGVVQRVYPIRETGYCVVLKGMAGTAPAKSIYCHLSSRGLVKRGAILDIGSKIGYVGKKLEHPHLHLELWLRGLSVSRRSPRALRDAIAGMVNA